MNVNARDTTRFVSVGLGVLIALIGVATIVGMPWQHLTGGPLLAAGRILGGLLTVGIGVATAWLALRD